MDARIRNVWDQIFVGTRGLADTVGSVAEALSDSIALAMMELAVAS